MVLSGGSTLFPNFDKRLTQELQRMTPSQMTARVVTGGSAARPRARTTSFRAKSAYRGSGTERSATATSTAARRW